ADVDVGLGALPGGGPVPAGGAAAQHAVGDQLVEHGQGGRPAEHVLDVVLGDRQLGRGAGQLGAEHVGVGGVEHAALDRRTQQRLRVVHQVGVHRVVAGDEHDER